MLQTKNYCKETQVCFGDSIESSYAIAGIELTEPIGRLDRIIKKPSSILEDIFSGFDNILNYIGYDITTNKIIIPKELQGVIVRSYAKIKDKNILIPLLNEILTINNNQYIVFISTDSERINKLRQKCYEDFIKKMLLSINIVVVI